MSSDEEKQVNSLEPSGNGVYDTTQNSSGPIEVNVPQMPKNNTNNGISPIIKPWSPVTLRPWFFIPLFVLMVAIAIALEVALHFSQMKKGWPIRSAFSATNGILHYVYTLPPVGIAMIIVALWAWTDLDIKRQQPYIDLARGNAPASRSLLLDYSGKHPVLVAASAIRHNHFLVAVSAGLVLLGLALQSLAAALFVVRSVYGDGPDLEVTNLQTAGLVKTFSDFTSFYVAAGATGAGVLYNVSTPQFVNGEWVIAAMSLPDTKTISNGTLSATTIGIHSLGNCQSPDTINLNTAPNGTSFTLTGTSGDCNASVPITTAGVFPSTQANIVGATCAGTSSAQFGPIAFWTFLQQADGQAPQSSLVFCRPTIAVMNVHATVQLPSGQLLDVTPLSNFSSNITDPSGPLQGLPLNGAVFNITGADPGTITRSQATRTALSTAIVIKAESLSGGLSAQLNNQSMMVNITQTLYQRYLSTAGKNNYFLPQESALHVTTLTFVPRLYIVPATTHILVVILLLTAFVGSFIHYFHARLRDRVVLLREPGTLASAAAYTAHSNIADIMDPYADGKTLNRMLKGKRFRMDHATGRIVVEGDEGYDELLSPVNHGFA